MTRRERALERIDSLDPDFTRAWLRRDWMASAIDAYEAEIAADLESEETVTRAIEAVVKSPGQKIGNMIIAPLHVDRDAMRAALRTVLEE